MMIAGVVAVIAEFEKRAELDGLVGFVVVHRARVEPRQPQAETGGEREPDERASERPRHFARP